MNAQNEQELIRLSKEHNMAALTAIYDQFSPAIYRYSFRLLGDDLLAEDCVADTFDRFLNALKAGGGPDDFLQAYLFRIAHNWITDFYRRRTVHDANELDDNIPSMDNPERDAISLMEKKKVRSAIIQLPTDQQQVITLRFLEGWEIEEVARSMNKTDGAIKALQHRAIANLQKLLDQPLDD